MIAVRGGLGSHDTVHVRLTDMLGDHWDSKLPHVDLLVIGGCHESLASLNKSDGVDASQVLVIGLYHFASIGIILQYLLVLEPGQEDILSAVLRVELQAVDVLVIRKLLQYFTSFGIPQNYLLVIPCR